ncbi:MAG: outer membrane lipoprotein carrier protein LolA [Phycisphaerae bacterium]|nr:outer membrane lipoprotein carrier protein LolA [Phycisphaerae bacterium]
MSHDLHAFRITPAWQALQFAIGIVLFCSPAHADSLADSLDESLSRLNERALAYNDLVADFVEQKYTAMLRKPMVSSGVIRVRGTRSRWDTRSPHESTLFTDDESIAIYFPQRKTMEVYAVDQRLRPLVMSPIPRLEVIRRFFDLESAAGSKTDPTELLLRMRPKDESLAEYVSEILVALDRELALVRRVEITDPDGDRTVIKFVNVRTNVGIGPGEVARGAPPGTKIVHPFAQSSEADPGGSKKTPPGSNPP